MNKNFMRTAKTALNALRRNSLRAFLTALGIIIGIAAVIVMMEIGQGSRASIEQTISGMGSNSILIMPGTAASGGVSFGAGTNTTLTASDAEAIGRETLFIQNVAPIVRARAQVVYGNKNWVPQYIYGTTQQYLQIRDWLPVAAGEAIDDKDVRVGAKVCLVGQTIVRELFGGADPIGQEIRIQNVGLKIVGVLSRKGANMMGTDQDDIVIAPWTTVKSRIAGSVSGQSGTTSGAAQTSNTSIFYPSVTQEYYPAANPDQNLINRRLDNIDQIQVAASTADAVKPAIAQVSDLLRQRHKIKPGEPDDFSIRDMTELGKALSSTSDLMTKLLLSVALISLVVGGIGIMNIMLVSVTERTREIGLRLAVGARERDILRQFLTEAVVLCLSGGIIGIILGRGISLLVRAVLGWNTQSSPLALIAAFLVAVTVGLVFGYFPAAKAAKLDPIEALRRE